MEMTLKLFIMISMALAICLATKTPKRNIEVEGDSDTDNDNGNKGTEGFKPTQAELQFVKDCRVVFNIFDQDSDNFITKEDIEKVLKNPEYTKMLPNQFKIGVNHAIDNHGGKISFEDYVIFMAQMEIQNPQASEQALDFYFRGQNKISRDKVCSLIPGLDKEHLNEYYTKDDFRALLKKIAEKDKE